MRFSDLDYAERVRQDVYGERRIQPGPITYTDRIPGAWHWRPWVHWLFGAALGFLAATLLAGWSGYSFCQ